MKSTNVRAIKEAVRLQAMKGTRQVSLDDGYRVIDAKTVKGQLKVKCIGYFGRWIPVSHVNID